LVVLSLLLKNAVPPCAAAKAGVNETENCACETTAAACFPRNTPCWISRSALQELRAARPQRVGPDARYLKEKNFDKLVYGAPATV
jgi:hypothetical protein